MKITHHQLRRLIRESILCEQDLKGFATTVAAYAFEEDGAMPDMSDPADLEWIATSDKEIQRIGQKYGQADSAKAFLSLSVEERKGLLKEVTDYERHQEVHWKEGDLVHQVDFEGDEWGGDYEKSVGNQIGTVIEIDKDPDGTQYTVHFPDGTTVMDTYDSFEAAS